MNHGHRHQGRRHGHRGRPPWWPEDHPWPPQGRPEWRGGRHVARRIGCALAVPLIVLGVIGTATLWLVLSAVGAVASAPFARAVSAVALVLGVVAVALAATVLRRLAAPAGRLVDAARRIEAGDYSERVPVRGPSELRSLARAFNDMSTRLQDDEARRRSVLADVAHELRTPLTVVRGQAEAVADGVYPASPESMAPILAATRTLEGLVDDLRTLALADAGMLRPARDPVDLAPLVGETLAGFAPAAAAAGVQLVSEVDPSVPRVAGDAARLSSVVVNLVSNALSHTARGGRVIVACAAAPGGVLLTVRDDGEGIPAELLPRVLDRFVKGPGSTGSGLGLAIVRDVVAAHGGTVVVGSEPGRGTEVRVTLPAANGAP